jgi:hypothetical protein
MKEMIISFLSLFMFIQLNAGDSWIGSNQKNNPDIPFNQELKLTATTTAATRLFTVRDDLTSVIMVIPKGSVVEVNDIDSVYFSITFEELKGFIFRRHAKLNDPAEVIAQAAVKPEAEVVEADAGRDQQNKPESRFSYLENQYGTSLATRMIAGKIWKGMTSGMVNDTWGSPQKINRVVSGNTIKEEWTFRNTWLYFENDILREWGPVKQ